MSVGNLKDQGNQGKNTPYQLRELQSLGNINDNLASILATLAAGIIQTGVEKTPGIITSTGISNLTSLSTLFNVSFYNSGSAAGTLTVNGTSISLPAGATINYDPGVNNYYKGSNFIWNATGTTFIVAYTTI